MPSPGPETNPEAETDDVAATGAGPGPERKPEPEVGRPPPLEL